MLDMDGDMFLMVKAHNSETLVNMAVNTPLWYMGPRVRIICDVDDDIREIL